MSERVTALARHDFPERPHQNAHLDCLVILLLFVRLLIDEPLRSGLRPPLRLSLSNKRKQSGHAAADDISWRRLSPSGVIVLPVSGGDRRFAAFHPEPGCPGHHGRCGSHVCRHGGGPPPRRDRAAPRHNRDHERQSSALLCFLLIFTFCPHCFSRAVSLETDSVSSRCRTGSWCGQETLF